jgi:hypothetical protein
MRLSLTRGARTSIAPAEVITWRGSARPLHHQPTTLLITLADEPTDVSVNLSLQRGGEHPPRPLPNDLIDQRPRRQRRRIHSRRTTLHDYREHGRAFPTSASDAGLCLTPTWPPGRYPHPALIHRFQALLAGTLVGQGLRHRGLVAGLSPNSPTPQLPAHRRRRVPQLPRDRPHPLAGGPPAGDLLPLPKGEATRAHRVLAGGERFGHHSANVPEPSPGHGDRHSDRLRCRGNHHAVCHAVDET